METSPLELARRYEEKYLHDMKLLGVEKVNLYARATEHIPEIIRQIAVLIKKGYAYETIREFTSMNQNLKTLES